MKIDPDRQCPEISKEFSLWNSPDPNTSEESVRHPIVDYLVYVEPVYLEASNTGSCLK